MRWSVFVRALLLAAAVLVAGGLVGGDRGAAIGAIIDGVLAVLAALWLVRGKT